MPTPAPLARRALSAGLAVVVAAALLGTVAAGTAGAETGEAGSFDDDAGSVYESALDALAGRGHLAGTECGPRSICPDEPISRWEMAVWLVRVLDGAEPDAVENVRFADIDADAWWSPHAERLFDLEVTRGCATDPLTYCPADAVKRGEMAAFLVRAFDLPVSGSVGFEDLAGHFHTESINALAAAGITAGCTATPSRFCPQDQVTRGQMAVFLARAMGLIGLPSTVQFSAVAVGGHHACGLRLDKTVTCWGENGSGQADALDGEFAAIAAGLAHSCGLRSDETIACWGHAVDGPSGPPEGQFSAIAAGGWHTCGLRDDNTVACWGDDSEGQSEPPEGEFSAIAAGGWHTCGLRDDNTVTCWGNNSDGQIDAPTVDLSAVVAGDRFSCGLRTDYRVVCWGGNNAGQTQAPARVFTSIAAGGWHACGLGTDMSLICWGDNAENQSRSPDLDFKAVSAGYGLSCGVTMNSQIACWGEPNEWSTAAPDGDYRAIVPVPIGTIGVTLASLSDPTECRPHGVSYDVTAGFPLPHWAVPSTGTIHVAVLFVDFPDGTAAHTTAEEAELGLPFTSEYINAVSYGRLQVEFSPLHGWLRTSRDFRSYSESLGSEWVVTPLIDGEAVQLADPNFDFTGYDSVLIVMPSPYFSGGTAGGFAKSHEGYVGPIARINNHSLESPRGPVWWGSVGAHELVHTLGLLDLYSYDSNREPSTSRLGYVIADAEFGLMSMHAFFETETNDHRLAHTWVHTDGYRSTAYRHHVHALEMLAWSRWQLGWLDPAQVRCVTEPEAVVTLQPIATPPDDGIAMAAIPLSDTDLIVIESRRKIGYDAGREHREPDGAHTTFPALAVEGVLVYTVDSSIGSGALPLKVAGDDGDGRVADYPVLTVGQSVTVRGYKITVTSDDGATHTVTIVKTDGA